MCPTLTTARLSSTALHITHTPANSCMWPTQGPLFFQFTLLGGLAVFFGCFSSFLSFFLSQVTPADALRAFASTRTCCPRPRNAGPRRERHTDPIDATPMDGSMPSSFFALDKTNIAPAERNYFEVTVSSPNNLFDIISIKYYLERHVGGGSK